MNVKVLLMMNCPHLLDGMVYCLGNGGVLYAKGNTTEKI